MIPVSDKWKTAQRQLLVPEAFIEIKYLATDPDVQGDLTSTSTSELFYSDTGSLVNELDKQVNKYSTLEDGLFMLDGFENYLPVSSYGKTGFVSNTICGSDCKFITPPLITITAGKVYENLIAGITLTWSNAYNEFPVGYEVTVWKDNTIITSYAVNDNADVTNVLEFDYNNWNKITIEILEWCLPNKRARMEEVVIGIERTYTKKDLMGYEHSQSCDILSGALPKNSITFKLDNSDNKWNPFNPSSIEKYLLERQELRVRYGFEVEDGNIEWIKAGTFYMSEWSTPSNGMSASFTARDLLEFMSDEYTGITSGTLYQICTNALRQADLPLNRDGSVRWYLSETLKSYTTDFTPTEDNGNQVYTISQVLQLCANAGKCLMYQDYNGIIRIEPQFIVLEDYRIDSFVNYSYPELKISKQLKEVDVNKGLGWHQVSDKGEIQTLENEFIISEDNANEVAEWVGNILKYRQTINGKFRIDPRVEVTDLISVESKFEVNHAVGLTNVKLTFNGAFRGTFEGRIFEFKPVDASIVGLPFSGEV